MLFLFTQRIRAVPASLSDLSSPANALPGWQFCVAPMIDVTDRHCRYFHRLLAPRARLYTEMITAPAILHGERGRILDFNPHEHPVALQLGGSDPTELARAAAWGERWGYDEINLNCGCPSNRVQQGDFGACLMARPLHVADCVRAMQDTVSIPVTVKHRLGLDTDESYGFVRDFVGILYDAGCRVFIVHARNAVLQGLSPKENRQIPPLRYHVVKRLKSDFPEATVVLNGGLSEVAQCLHWLQHVDGVMLGRAAWHHPDTLVHLHRALYSDHPLPSTEEVLAEIQGYIARQHADGMSMTILLRGLLGWHAGQPGARQWRRALSDPQTLRALGPAALQLAWQALHSNQAPQPLGMVHTRASMA